MSEQPRKLQKPRRRVQRAAAAPDTGVHAAESDAVGQEPVVRAGGDEGAHEATAPHEHSGSEQPGSLAVEPDEPHGFAQRAQYGVEVGTRRVKDTAHLLHEGYEDLKERAEHVAEMLPSREQLSEDVHRGAKAAKRGALRAAGWLREQTERLRNSETLKRFFASLRARFARALRWARAQQENVSRQIAFWVIVFTAATLLVAWAIFGVFPLSLWVSTHDPNVRDQLKLAGIAVGALGAVALLVLNYRKQKVAEAGHQLSQNADVRAQSAQFAERFEAATQQLGHSSAPIRVAGVYALARLADDWDAGRQQCIDTLCAYVRFPLPPAEAASDAAAEKTDAVVQPDGDPYEIQVRQTVFSVVRQHLNHDAEECDEMRAGAACWHGNRFDFSGAHLNYDVDLRRIQTIFGTEISFESVNFSAGTVNFSDAEFSAGLVDFTAAKFTGSNAQFLRVKFSGGSVNFSFAEFSSGIVHFTEATFSGGKVIFFLPKISRSLVSFETARFEPKTCEVVLSLRPGSAGNVFWGPFGELAAESLQHGR